MGSQIDAKEPRRWLLIEQECAVPSEEGGAGRWAIDHLFLDQDAIPTIVEVKRTDTRARREVVGQMLDYTANAVAHWPVANMRERFAANCKSTGVNPEQKLREFLLEEEIEPEEFWQMADRNLQDRKIRLLFVADVIPTELQRIVEFLNDQMDQTEVLAIEIKQFVAEEGLRSLVPRVIGQTAKGRDKKPGGPRTAKKDEVSFFEALERNGATTEDVEVARRILEWAEETFSEINWGRASFSPVLDCGHAHSFNPISVYASQKSRLNAKLKLRFVRMMEKNPPFDSVEKRLELLRRLNEIPGIDLPEDSIGKPLLVPLSPLVDDQAFVRFRQAIEWTIEEVKANAG